jgi:ABC-type nitrate/sulfonate/bicarbonate transport system permease component
MGGRAITDRLIGLATPLLLLGLWELCARIGWIDIRFFPAPSQIIAKLIVLARSGELAQHIWISLQRLFWGFLVGGIPAIVLGICMGLWRPIRLALEPLVAATYPLPKSAILPLILLIFGLGEASKIAMVALGVFYPIIINTMSGVLQIPSIYLDVGKNFNASPWQKFYTIALPGALPSIMAGIKLGVGLGLILIAIAEMVGADSGVGYMIWNAWQVLSIDVMFVGLLTIALIGFVLSLILDEIEGLVLPARRGK